MSSDAEIYAVVANVSKLKGLKTKVIGNSLIISSEISIITNKSEFLKYGMWILKKVFVDCSLEAAESRDPKGLYKKARAGEIKNFTGIDDPYEAPSAPEIHLHTDQQTLEEEVSQIIVVLKARGLISAS